MHGYIRLECCDFAHNITNDLFIEVQNADLSRLGTLISLHVNKISK